MEPQMLQILQEFLGLIMILESPVLKVFIWFFKVCIFCLTTEEIEATSDENVNGELDKRTCLILARILFELESK